MSRKPKVVAFLVLAVLVLLGLRRFLAATRTAQNGDVNVEATEPITETVDILERPRADAPPPVASAQSPVEAPSRSVTHVAVAPSPPAPTESNTTCPPEQPIDGRSCGLSEKAALRCIYGQEPSQITCDCTSEEKPSVWRCGVIAKTQPVPACPVTRPDNGGTCRSHGSACIYGSGPESLVCTCGLPEEPIWRCTTYHEWRGLK